MLLKEEHAPFRYNVFVSELMWTRTYNIQEFTNLSTYRDFLHSVRGDAPETRFDVCFEAKPEAFDLQLHVPKTEH